VNLPQRRRARDEVVAQQEITRQDLRNLTLQPG
jgi:hypothetical protein